MALSHLGISRSQEDIGRILKIRMGFGVPAPNIAALRSRTIDVAYRVGGTFADILRLLNANVPVIAFVQAAELPHWSNTRSQHAVLIVGIGDDEIVLHDPALDHGPTSVPIGDFSLAWDEMENRFATLTKRTR